MNRIVKGMSYTKISELYPYNLKYDILPEQVLRWIRQNPETVVNFPKHLKFRTEDALILVKMMIK